MSGPILALDEFGRPFVILKDQSTKTRLHGIQATKVVQLYYYGAADIITGIYVLVWLQALS